MQWSLSSLPSLLPNCPSPLVRGCDVEKPLSQRPTLRLMYDLKAQQSAKAHLFLLLMSLVRRGRRYYQSLLCILGWQGRVYHAERRRCRPSPSLSSSSSGGSLPPFALRLVMRKSDNVHHYILQQIRNVGGGMGMMIMILLVALWSRRRRPPLRSSLVKHS